MQEKREHPLSGFSRDERLYLSSFWLHRTGHTPVRSKIRLARIENAPELVAPGRSVRKETRAMRRFGTAKARISVTIAGSLLLAIVTVILIAALVTFNL